MKSIAASIAWALLLIVLLIAGVFPVHSYNVRIVYQRSPSGQSGFQSRGFCQESDPASHMFMPSLESYQTKALSALQGGGGTKAPLGGVAAQAYCLDTQCSWNYTEGIYLYNERTFFQGVFYEGQDKTRRVPEFYANWAPGYPQYWANLSFWGNRKPAISTPEGTWTNVEAATRFSDWLCEYHEYTQSDRSFLPTFVNGDPVPPEFYETHSHCGHVLELDSKGRYRDVECKKSFPWWGGLIIAVCCFIFIITMIIVIWCCCFCCGERRETGQINEKLASVRDNDSHIPTQSEIGMGANNSSFMGSGDYSNEGDEEQDNDSFYRGD